MHRPMKAAIRVEGHHSLVTPIQWKLVVDQVAWHRVESPLAGDTYSVETCR